MSASLLTFHHVIVQQDNPCQNPVPCPWTSQSSEQWAKSNKEVSLFFINYTALWIMRSGVQDQPGQHGETPSLLKMQKIRQVWWQTPVILVTWEAEAGELHEPGRQRLKWTKIMPLHYSLGDRARLCLKKEKKIFFDSCLNWFCMQHLFKTISFYNVLQLYVSFVNPTNPLIGEI